MRLSVRENDQGFHPMAYGAKVFVDGVKVEQCFTADEESGIAYCYATDQSGCPFIDPESPDECKEIEVRGHVKIVPPPTWESDTA